MAGLSRVVTVSLNKDASAVARDNMNCVAIMTSENDFLNSNNRYGIYESIDDVASDFGTSSKAYAFASALFGNSPNPVQNDGQVIIGFWRAASETVAATAGVLTGEQQSEATLLGILQEISDGSLSINIDGTDYELTDLDFQGCADFDDVIDVLQTALTAALSGTTVEEDDQSIKITSPTTGATSVVGFASEATSGTFVGSALGLSSESGATSVDGTDETTEAAETKVEAVTELKSQIAFRGAMFIDNPTDDEALLLAAWAQSNDILMYDVFDDDDNLEASTDNVVWNIKLNSYENYRCLYNKAGNRKMAVSYMARLHVVNFEASKTAITMHLKELNGVAAEDLSTTVLTKAKRVGMDCYVTIKDTEKVLSSGANEFVDNVYNLLAYQNAIQTDVFNVLGTTSTKVAQTDEDVQLLVDQAEKTSEQFVTAGVFAPGTWTSSNTFGNAETLKKNITKKGYYVMANKMADQSTANRQARKSPALQVAVKNAGAVHSVNIIINFNY